MLQESGSLFDVGLDFISPHDPKQQFVFRHQKIYCYAGQHYNSRLYSLQYQGNGDSDSLVVCGLSRETSSEEMNLVSTEVGTKHVIINTEENLAEIFTFQ